MTRASEFPTSADDPSMKAQQRFLFGGGGGGDLLADTGLTILRLFTGLALAFAHGINKLPPAEGFVNRIGGFGFPLPEVFAWFSGFAEFACGLLLAIGLLTRPAALLIAINMLVAVLFAHILQGDTFRGMELAAFFLAAAVCFLLVGGGRYSVDSLIRSRSDSRTVSRYVRD